MNILQSIIVGLFAFIGFIGIILVIGLLIAFPVMWLWNGCLVGLVAGITPITSVWQALGLILLTSFLFKSANIPTSKS